MRRERPAAVEFVVFALAVFLAAFLAFHAYTRWSRRGPAVQAEEVKPVPVETRNTLQSSGTEGGVSSLPPARMIAGGSSHSSSQTAVPAPK